VILTLVIAHETSLKKIVTTNAWLGAVTNDEATEEKRCENFSLTTHWLLSLSPRRCQPEVPCDLLFVFVCAVSIALLAQPAPTPHCMQRSLALVQAAHDRDWSLVRRLCTHAAPNTVGDVNGTLPHTLITPLMYAVMSDAVDAAEALIAAGAALETRDGEGCTPLLLAAHRGAARCLPVLLRAGANPEAVYVANAQHRVIHHRSH